MMLTQADQGWAWVVLGAVFCMQIVMGSMTYSAGIIQVLLLERFNEGNTKTSLAASLFVFFLSSGGVFGSVIIRRYGCKVAVTIGTLLTTFGFVCSVYVTSLNWMYVTYGTMAGIGCGINYNTAIISIGFNFVKHRNFASGLSFAGVGLGSLMFPLVTEASWEVYGNKQFFFIPAAASIQQMVFGFLMFPSSIEIEQRVKAKNDTSNMKQCTLFLELLKTPSIVCVSTGLFLGHFSVYLIFIHFPSYAISFGSTSLEASSLLSIAGVCNMFSRILAGLASNDDGVDELLIINGCYGILGLATCFLPFYGITYGGQILYAIILGTYFGCCYVVIASLNIRLVGMQYVAPAIGLEMAILAFGAISGAPVGGAILEKGGTYHQCFVMSGLILLLATVIGMLAAVFKTKPNDQQWKEPVDIEITTETLLKKRSNVKHQQEIYRHGTKDKEEGKDST